MRAVNSRHLPGVEHDARRGGHEAQERGDEFGVGEIFADRAGDAGVLDLDRDVTAIVKGGAVHLADRGRCQRVVVEVRERTSPRAEFALQNVLDESRRHRRGGSLESGKRSLVWRKAAGAHGAGVHQGRQLTELHQRPLGVAEQLGVPVGGLGVEAVDGAMVTGALPQPSEQPTTGRAGAEPRQRHRAPDASNGYRIVVGGHRVDLLAGQPLDVKVIPDRQ